MVWSYEQYKKDENHVFSTLFAMADRPVTFQAWDAIDRSQVWRAIDIICQGVGAVPQKVRDALRRVIYARECATKFYTRIQSADADHESWLLFLIDILATLERHATISCALNMVREDDLRNGRISLQSGSDIVPTLPKNRCQTTRKGVSPIEYAQSSKETAVANFVSDLVIIHDWIKIQWTCAARGKSDLATVAYSSYAARKLARQVLYSVELEIGWKDPIFLDYANKAGLFSNENEYVSASLHSTFIVILRQQTKIRWHVYSDVGEHMHAPRFENSCGSDMPAQLERWLFCAAIAGWDVDQELTAAQDRCLLAALTTQMHTLIHYKRTTTTTGFRHVAREAAGTSPLGHTLEKLQSFSDRLRSLKFSPDPWTLSHIIAQSTSLIHYQEIALSIDRLCAAAYAEKYRAIAKSSSKTTLQNDFGCLLPTGSVNNFTELERAWTLQKRNPARIEEKIESMQWTWKVFEDKHIPRMFSDFDSSRNYISMLDKIKSRVSEINGRRLNIKALPVLSSAWTTLALQDLVKVDLTGDLYIPASTIRYGPCLLLYFE